MIFNNNITFTKLKLFALLVFAVNTGFAQNYATCTAANVAGALVNVNGACKVVSIIAASTVIEAPLGTPSCFPSAPTMDCWFRFVLTAPVTSLTISVQSTNANFGFGFVVYNSCPGGAEVGCINANTAITAHTETLNLGALAAGTYWGRILKINGTSTNITPLTICIKSPVVNDEPAGAIALPAVNSSCAYTIMNLKYASQSTCAGSLAAPSCGWIGSSQDIWYSVQVPPSGNLFLQTNYSGTDLGIATYTGTPCAGLTQISCSEGSPEGATSGDPSLNVPGLAAGTPVYIRVWNKVASTVLTNTSTTAPPTYSLCATDLGPCGNLPNNDWCSNPATINTSGSTFTSVASNTVGTGPTGVYTSDAPGDLLTSFCGNLGQNAWFSFIATSASQSIPFTVGNIGAGCASGLDAEVFSVATNTYGCCKTFTPLSSSSCTNYNIPVGTGTIVAAPLVPGNTYYLMVNSAPGEACTYSVTGWSATGILPTELVSFKGTNEGKYNVIEWITSTENNIKSYTLEHSNSGNDFTPVATIQAKGNNTSNTNYKVQDNSPFDDVTYYRVKNTDNNGTEKYSNVISVNLRSKYDNVYNIHPNPTNNNLNFEYYSKANNSINIELLNYAGASVLELNQLLEEGKNNVTLPMSELDNGVYILKVVSEKSGKTNHHKIIKN